MTEIERLRTDIEDLASQIDKAKTDFAAALKERENELEKMRLDLARLEEEDKREHERKQAQLETELHKVEEERHRLEEREALLRAELKEEPHVSETRHSEQPTRTKIEPTKDKYEPRENRAPQTPLSSNERNSLRDAIFATKSAPVAAGYMGGTPIGAAQAVAPKITPLQRPEEFGAHTFSKNDWQTARMRTFEETPVDHPKNDETLL